MTDQTASNGTILGGFLIPMFHGTDAVIFGWLIAGMWLLGTIVMIIRYGPRNHRRSRCRLRLSQQEKANNIPGLDADMENRETAITDGKAIRSEGTLIGLVGSSERPAHEATAAEKSQVESRAWT